MSIHIIIDGYNLIRQSPKLSLLDQQDLQLGRDALIEMLAAYKKIKRHKITVVFDGNDAYDFSQNNDFFKGITIKFSRNGESADTVIKKMAYKEREKALIVSSDRDISDYAVSCNAYAISSSVFEEKVEMAAYFETKRIVDKEEYNNGWVPTTKKRGPKRKLPKIKRKSKIKVRKL